MQKKINDVEPMFINIFFFVFIILFVMAVVEVVATVVDSLGRCFTKILYSFVSSIFSKN